MSGAVVVWLVAAVIFGLIEAGTVALVSVWMAIAAILAAVAAALNLGITTQVLVFLFATIVLLVLTAPLTKKFRAKGIIFTNADRLFGQEAVVLTPIDPIENHGTVKVLGQVWSASGKNGETFSEGETVIVENIEGVRVVVGKKL